jgi:serine/threonine protein kinase
VLPEELTVACKIGEGGFGAVLKGFWHGKSVAVKQLHERVRTPSASDGRNHHRSNRLYCLLQTGLEKEEEAKYQIKKFDEFKHEAFIMR